MRWICLHSTDTDDCGENDCQNGATCVDGVNDYTCDCADGFEGEDCGTSKIYVDNVI